MLTIPSSVKIYIYSRPAACKLQGHDPYAYFNDMLRRISTHPAVQIDELLPCNWTPPANRDSRFMPRDGNIRLKCYATTSGADLQ